MQDGNYFQKQKTFNSPIFLTSHLFLHFLLYISLYVAAVLLYFQNLCARVDLFFYYFYIYIYIYIFDFTSHYSCLQEHIHWNQKAFETFFCSGHNAYNARKSGKGSCLAILMYVPCFLYSLLFRPRNVQRIYIYIYLFIGQAVTQWLRHYATNRQVAGSMPDGVIEIFQ